MSIVNKPQYCTMNKQIVCVNEGGGITLLCGDDYYNDYIPPDMALEFALEIIDLHGKHIVTKK